MMNDDRLFLAFLFDFFDLGCGDVHALFILFLCRKSCFGWSFPVERDGTPRFTK
jgi:hypothetical protein